MINKLLLCIAVVIAAAIGAFGSIDSGSDTWYQSLQRSILTPPDFIFGIIWPILYAFMIVFIIIGASYNSFSNIYKTFVAQLLLNAAWPWLFFTYHLPKVALINIVILVVLNARIVKIICHDFRDIYGYLHVPYLLWLMFAAYLNLIIVISN